jgi:hypothetical protein
MVGRRPLLSVKRDGKVGRRALFTVRLDRNVGKRAVRGAGADGIAQRRAFLDGFRTLRGRKDTFRAGSACPTGVPATVQGVRSRAATENGEVTSEKATMLELPARFAGRKGGPTTRPSRFPSDKARFVTQPAPFPARKGRLPTHPCRPLGPRANLSTPIVHSKEVGCALVTLSAFRRGSRRWGARRREAGRTCAE